MSVEHQPLESNALTLAVQKGLDEIQDIYDSQPENESTNMFCLGGVGAGKSKLIETLRMPALVHSFDPGGTKTIRHIIRKADNPKGTVLADTRFERENALKPSAYALWESEMTKLTRSGIFANIGTYVIDSSTNWAASALNKIIADRGMIGKMQIPWGIYQILLTTLINEMTLMMALPCDVYITGHLTYEKDDLLGKTIARPLIPGQSRERMPIVFDEVWVLNVKATPSGNTRQILTQNDGYFECATRLKDLKKWEEPDVKAMLRKGGVRNTDMPMPWLETGGTVGP